MNKFDQVLFHAIDRSSLLRRLEMQGVDVGDRWADVVEVARPHLEDHASVFQGAHALLSCLGAKEISVAKDYLAKVRDISKKSLGKSYYQKTLKETGLPLYEGLIAYEEKDYASAFRLMYPIRYTFPNIGGSSAQRDVFWLILTNAGILSPDTHHNKLAQALLYERKSWSSDSPMTDAMLARALANHEKTDVTPNL